MTIHEDATPRRRRQKLLPVFELLNAHAVCAFRLLDKAKLVVPTNEYQRDESDGRISTEIAMHYDVVAFHTLLVIERVDGTLIVADGGTRLSAALKRTDIEQVPCIVFSGLTEKQEADVFLRVNCNRRKLQTEQQHHAELFSDHDLAVRTQALMDRLHRCRVGFDSLRTMRGCVKSSYIDIETVVSILIQIVTDRHVTSRVMKGLFRLELLLRKEQRTLNRKPTIKRMQAEFHTFDAVVNAVVKPRSPGSMTDMAKVLARTLRIKFPKD